MMSEKRLYQTIAREIRVLIDSGDFPVGARLPGERELAERFKVSRVTIREAEIALEAQGRIAIRTGSGVYVTARPEGAPDSLPNVTAFELTAARAVIEAIREPSEAMLKAAEDVDFIGPGENDAAGEYRAMIDALLEEGA